MYNVIQIHVQYTGIYAEAKNDQNAVTMPV